MAPRISQNALIDFSLDTCYIIHTTNFSVDRLNQILDQYKLPLGLSFVGLILIVGGLFSSGLFKNSAKLTSDQFPKESIINSESELIKVDISGAVKKPGVYSLTSTDRIEDLVKAAGGFESSASAEYISRQLNLSQKISDGQKVYIPFEGESYQPAMVAGVSTSGSNIVGLNTGSSTDLEGLPGVGSVTAGKIIAKRPYKSVEELITRKVIGRSVYEKIKDLVSTN